MQLLTGGESVAELIADVVLRHGDRTFHVVDPAGNLRGLVALEDLARVADADRAHTRTDQVMTPLARLVVLRPESTGWQALRTMVKDGVNQLPVVSSGRVLGAVTRARLLGVVQAGATLETRRV